MAATHFTAQLLGPQLAFRFLLTGQVWRVHCMVVTHGTQVIKGEEALKIGLVSQIADEADVLPKALELATTIASNSPVAVQTCVQTLRFVSFVV
jgi:enoyl-CoA hydratase/carnithine racemase